MPTVNVNVPSVEKINFDSYLMTQGWTKDGSLWTKSTGWFSYKSFEIDKTTSEMYIHEVDFQEAFLIASVYESLFATTVTIKKADFWHGRIWRP